MRIPYLLAQVSVVCAVLLAGHVFAAQPQLPAGFDPARHMSLQEIRPGMTGYGLSVFSGTQPESFDVEVVSIEPAWQPGKSVIWIRCTGQRMQKLGPVQGMSGSPIYLWTAADRSRRRDGTTGRIIGAFAYGFPMGKDAYVGVQPIEQMLAAAARAKAPKKTDVATTNGSGLLKSTLAAIDALRLPRHKRWRADVAAKLAGIDPASIPLAPTEPTDPSASRMLALPLMVGSAQDARMLAPLFRGSGLQPVAGATAATGVAPAWINPQQARLEPGGVLSVPLAMGDVDLSAVGTITDVLRDREGRITSVLGFGHSFMGEGATHVPMATGYVHYVQPSLRSSFKMGGTLQVKGSIINDEETGVIGWETVQPRFRPATVSVSWPEASKSRTYNYRITDHDYYLPMLAGYTAVMSIGSDTTIPPHSTMAVQSTLKFSGNHTIKVRGLVPDAGGAEVFSQLMPYLALLTDNEFEPLKLESAETHIKILPKVLAASLENVTLERSVVRPGEKVVAQVKLKPFRGETFTHRCEIKLPDDLPDGTYPLLIGGADSYVQQRMETHPHLTRVTSLDDLLAALRELNAPREDALYTMVVIQPERGLAIGRTELPKLPTSRIAMLGTATSTQVTPYIRTLEHSEPMDYVILGQLNLPVTVMKYPERAQ
jgi:hypothetical protein